MSRAYIAKLLNDSFSSYLVNEGVMLHMGMNGKSSGLKKVDLNLTAFQEVDVISIIKYANGCELALSIDDTLFKKVIDIELSSLVGYLYKLGGLITATSLKDEQGFTRYVYVYRKSCLNKFKMEVFPNGY